jgi:predicted metal-dependent peptidase
VFTPIKQDDRLHIWRAITNLPKRAKATQRREIARRRHLSVIAHLKASFSEQLPV